MFQRVLLVLIIRKMFNQCDSYMPIFSPLHSDINREQHEKHFYHQSSHYKKIRSLKHLTTNQQKVGV